MTISYEDFKKLDEYQSFISENPDIGILKVQVFTAYGAIPIADTDILISKDIGNYRVVFFQGRTDSSGIISDIELPAPIADVIPNPEVPPKYTLYSLSAIHTGYESIKQYSIGMFGGVKIIQYVKMNPEIVFNEESNNGN